MKNESIMLSSISWPQYLTAIVIVTALYYMYVLFTYYRSEINSRFIHKRSSHELVPSVHSAASRVIGDARADKGADSRNSVEIQFADVLPDEVETGSTNNTPKHVNNAMNSSSSELIHQISQLIDIFKDVDNRQEFFSLLTILVEPYKMFRNTIDITETLKQVAELAGEKLPFPVSVAELESSWT